MDTKTAQPSVQNPKINLVIDEINRGKKYSRLLDERQSSIKAKSDEAEADAKRKSEEAADALYKQLYPDVYVERCIVPEYAPNYGDCRHIRKNVIDRDALDIKQHINLLAQPKFVTKRIVEKPYIVRRKVPGPSHRIAELARPKTWKVLDTCKQYGATMHKFCIENCYRNIQDVTFVPVHDAVYFIKLNKRKPLIEKQKLQLRMKRLQERINEARMAKMQEMIRKLYLPLKRLLLAPPTENVSKVAKCSKCNRGAKCVECVRAARKAAMAAKIAEDAEAAKNPLLIQASKDAKKARDEQLAQEAEDAKKAKEIKDAIDAQAAQDAQAAKDANAPLTEDEKALHLGYVVRSKIVEMLGRTEEIKVDSQLDRFLAQISTKLAGWMKRLLNSEVMEVTTEATEVITDVVEEIIEAVAVEVVSEVVTAVAQNAFAGVVQSIGATVAQIPATTVAGLATSDANATTTANSTMPQEP